MHSQSSSSKVTTPSRTKVVTHSILSSSAKVHALLKRRRSSPWLQPSTASATFVRCCPARKRRYHGCQVKRMGCCCCKEGGGDWLWHHHAPSRGCTSPNGLQGRETTKAAPCKTMDAAVRERSCCTFVREEELLKRTLLQVASRMDTLG